MKRFAQQFKKQSEKIKLSAEEQFVLRERISTFMEYHPLPATKQSAERAISLTEPFVVVRVPWRKWRVSAGLVVAAVVIVLPAAAEYSVPGDILYPMKVSINEEVRSTLARTPFERVEWESQRIERRISEARILAKAGRLTPEAEAAVVEAVTQHRNNADAEIAILRDTNNLDEFTLANMTLASVFEVQSAVYEDEAAGATVLNASTGTVSAQSLAQVIEGGKLDFMARANSEGISYERLMAEIEKQTTRAYERLFSIESSLTPQESADLTRRLSDVTNRVGALQEAIDKTASTTIAIGYDALSDTKKLIAFMNDIDVRRTVALERIVPMQLTDEERISRFALGYRTLVEEVAALTAVLPRVSDAAVTEKADFYLEQLRIFIETYPAVDSSILAQAETQLIIHQDIVASLQQIVEPTMPIVLPVLIDADNSDSNATTTATSSASTGEGVGDVAVEQE